MEARKIEQELLANIIEFGAPHDFALIRKILKAEDFSEEKHREIWEMVCAIADKGEAIDIMRVFVEARARGLSNPADIVTMGADKCRGEMAALAMDIAIEAKRRSLVDALRHGNGGEAEARLHMQAHRQCAALQLAVHLGAHSDAGGAPR